jgi:hypothetical protein
MTPRLGSAIAVLAVALCVSTFAREGEQAAGKVTGSVKLTLASAAPSSAAAYDRRAVGPRPKPLPELKNVIIFFADLPATWLDLCDIKVMFSR